MAECSSAPQTPIDDDASGDPITRLPALNEGTREVPDRSEDLAAFMRPWTSKDKFAPASPTSFAIVNPLPPGSNAMATSSGLPWATRQQLHIQKQKSILAELDNAIATEQEKLATIEQLEKRSKAMKHRAWLRKDQVTGEENNVSEAVQNFLLDVGEWMFYAQKILHAANPHSYVVDPTFDSTFWLDRKP